MKIDIPSHIINAYSVLDGEQISYEEALELIKTNLPYNLDLYSLANKVKIKFTGKGLSTCEIVNAKSGACSEDCSFCAQSAHFQTGKPVYPLKPKNELLKAAKIAKEHGANAFCIVVSGLGYKKVNNEFKSIIDAAKAIIAETGMELHCSIGILSEETAFMLKEAGVKMINHNIESAPSFFDKICSTHSIRDRINTIKVAKHVGLQVCCGGIFGLGENPEQRVEFAFTLKELDVDGIPINIHQKIEGTRAPETNISPIEALNAIAILRLINPSKKIKIAAGRNTFFADYQALLFYAGADGMLIGNYLTINGRNIDDDQKLITQLKGM
ncbi:MAG TPA: biotin synthase BioB [Victivallales bacterium]|nr:biotin synthase BioB [Victivallales bacterium]HPO90510.1 biotin synthase BioB [Victivallales bacterium]HRR29205.1 biotin synthase BioB [Victivallales bacterium]HRU01993.1 biotin synthase BioB [Victivallales bacterium]